MSKKLYVGRLAVVGVFVFLMFAYHLTFGSYFPLPNGLMGHDYVLTLSSFVDGFLWFRNNGFLTPPWFTPSFCGGQAYFADPQSIFYSVPQFIAFFVEPVTASYLAMLIFAGLGFWGTYFLARGPLQLSTMASLVAACLFMFNGFYSHRMIIGHYGFQPWMLVPWVAWLLCLPKSSKSAGIVVGVGLLLAYWLQGGMATLIIPAALSVVALVCWADLIRPGRLLPAIFRGLAGGLLALMICASKLTASIALIRHFPRNFYPLPGLDDPWDILIFASQALFDSGQRTYDRVTPLWKNMQWQALPHELTYGVTFLPAIVILIGFFFYLPRLRECKPPKFSASGLLLLAILPIPLSLLYYSPEWNDIIKSLPVVGSTTSPYRWLIVYIPLLSLFTAKIIDRPQILPVAFVISMLAVPGLSALEKSDFYTSQNFNPSPLQQFYRAIREGKIEPRITNIASDGSPQGRDHQLHFVKGASALRCYNPLFGYRLEKFVQEPLAAGPIEQPTKLGGLNFRNPACLLFPEENHCKPWDSFRMEHLEKMQSFAGYRGFEFEKSTYQHLADAVTMITLAAIFLFVLFAGCSAIRTINRSTIL